MKIYGGLLVISSILMLFLSGCAVGMAASGKKNVNTSILTAGAPRSIVILELGPPETSTVDDEGNYVESYLIVKGNEPSSERAFLHSELDSATLGLWEIIGTPIELLSGGESLTRATIYYNADKRIRDIQFVEVEANEDTKQSTESNQTGGIIQQNN